MPAVPYSRTIFLACSAFVLATAHESSAQGVCNQTLSPGANVAAAISGAGAGSTICLNSGSYGSLTVSGISKSTTVTIRSSTGTNASFGMTEIAAVNGLRFTNLQFPSGVAIDGGGGTSKNLSIEKSLFIGSQLILNTTGNTAANILIDGNTFNGYNSTGFEGRITIWRNPPTGLNQGVTISNNTFGGGGCSDGIQLSGGANGITIGPGNTFQDMIQGSCGPHVDAIQFVGGSGYTVTGNFFRNNTIHLGIYDGCSNVTVTNNIFTDGESGWQNFQIGGCSNFTFTHNTVRNSTFAHGTKAGDTPNNNWVMRDSIFQNSSLINAGAQPQCNTCTYDRLMFSTSAAARGTNQIIGNPTYSGGATPPSWAGWQLATGSLGRNAASDGGDVGTNYYGTGSLPQRPAPKNLHIKPKT